MGMRMRLSFGTGPIDALAHTLTTFGRHTRSASKQAIEYRVDQLLVLPGERARGRVAGDRPHGSLPRARSSAVRLGTHQSRGNALWLAGRVAAGDGWGPAIVPRERPVSEQLAHPEGAAGGE